MRGLAVVSVLAFVAACSGSCGSSQPLPTSDRAPIPVRITIVNDRADTVYLTSQSRCAFAPLAFSFGGTPLRTQQDQSFSCEEAKRGPCPDVGSCAGPGVRPLAAGERWTVSWDGVHFVQASIDRSEAGDNCPTSCVVALPPEPGPLDVSVEAHSRCDAPGCDCELEGDWSSCYPEAALPDATDLRAQTTVTLPDRSTEPLEAEVHFR